MRILFLALDVDLGLPSGDAIHTMELSKALQERGHRVNVVAGRAPSTLSFYTAEVDVIEAAGNGDFEVLKQCIRIGKTTKTEAIYERRYSPKISYAVSRRLRIPYLVEVNGIVADEKSALGRSGDSRRLPKLRVLTRRHFLRKAAALVAVSPGIRRHLIRTYSLDKSRVRVIPNGVDSDLFAPHNSVAARRVLGLPEDAGIILFAGNLVPWQGLTSLVEASHEVLAKHPRARFVLVGDGPMRDSVSEKTVELGVEHAFMLNGTVAHEDVPKWIAASDLCVAPFTRERNLKAELSPLKLYEYMACARPVVATEIPGVAELLRRSQSGLVVPPDDSESLGAAISSLLDDPEECRKMGERGRRTVLEGFTWNHTAMQVEKALEEAVS